MIKVYQLPPLTTANVSIPSYAITPSPLPLDLLKGEEKITYDSIIESVGDGAKQALKRIERELGHIENHPKVMSLRIYLAIQLRQVRKANQLIEKNYRMNPQSVGAFLNYADLLVRKKKIGEFERLFPRGDLSLKGAFPHMKRFYAADVRLHLVTMAHFYLAQKRVEEAKGYYSSAYKIEPNHPSVIRLEKLLSKGSWTRRLNWWWQELKPLWGAGRKHPQKYK